MINVVVNGDAFELNGADVSALIKQLGADDSRVAVMVNDAIVPRDTFGACRLAAGDRVEVLSFAGGG
jgi:thiamine biosynthesis protein ThiS